MSEQAKSRAEIRFKKLFLPLLILLLSASTALFYYHKDQKELLLPKKNTTQNNSATIPSTKSAKITEQHHDDKPISSLEEKAKEEIVAENNSKPASQITFPKTNIPQKEKSSSNKATKSKVAPETVIKTVPIKATKPSIKRNAPDKKDDKQQKLIAQANMLSQTVTVLEPHKPKDPPPKAANKKKSKIIKKSEGKHRTKAAMQADILSTAKIKTTTSARVTSLSNTEKKVPENSSIKPTHNLKKTSPEPAEEQDISEDYIETAFDLFVGGNYFGFVMLKYNDNWIELLDPQEAIALLPLIKNRQTMLPLFEGQITNKREIPELGNIEVDYNNFAINVTIAPEQALEVKVDKKKSGEYEGSPTFLTRLGIKGNKPIDVVDDSSRFSATNNTRFAYNQYRLQTSGSFSDFDNEYKLDTFQGEADFELFEAPLTVAGGLLDTPGQLFASSVNIFGISLFSNHKLYANDPLLKSNELEVFVPTRALVEVFKNDSETGVVLYSRMHDFGHTQIDTRKFPRGSYPIVIIISVDGIERARYNEQFYKYEEILPRETVDLYLSFGKLRDNLKEVDFPVFFGSIRTRLWHDLEGSFSFYTLDDRTILSQSLKKIFNTKTMGEFTVKFTLSESNSTSILGHETDLRWRGKSTSASIKYSKSFSDDTINYQDLDVLSFKEKDAINLSISRNFTVWNRTLNLSIKGQYRDNQDTGITYRYGPSVRFTPYRGKQTNIIISAQHDYTHTGNETRFQANLTYRLDPITIGSFYNRAKQPSQTATNWQQYLQYTGNEKSYGKLKNVSAKAVYSASQSQQSDGKDSKTAIKNLNVAYEGSTIQSGAYFNKSSGEQGGYFGGELLTTFVAGSNNLMQMAGSVPIGSGIIAISLEGDIDDEKLISVLINGNRKAYIKTGEVAFIEAPVYKTSKVEIRDATPKKGAFIKIVNPYTEVTPYPGNIVHRSFEIARLAIISGSLLKENGEPVSNLFFETGYEPAYTDSDGLFIIEMPIRASEKQFDFIARDHICTFDIPKVPKDSLVEVGDVQCRLANQDELRLIRTMHDETRIYD